MSRMDGRAFDELRPVKFETDFVKFPEGSVLVTCGNTKVLCCASVRGCSIPSVQDADFSETRRKIQLSADVWPARVADNGRCHPCRCGGGKDVHARYQASTIKLTCIQNANLRT